MTSTTTQASTTEPRGSKRAWFSIIAILMLTVIGMTIVLPVLPFVVQQYLPNGKSLALWVGLLEAVNAFCAFLVTPLLGGLSDRFGRRPVLIFSVFGSAASLALFGFGGALWVLFLARAIQGFSAGDIPAITAYAADITKPEDRAKRFGMIGALMGIAFMAGPAIGGLLATISLSAPLYATAAISAFVGIFAFFVLPESLKEENRATSFKVTDFHPVKVLKDAFGRKELRGLLIGFVLVSIPFFFYANNVSVLAKDSNGWGATQVGLVLSGIGVLDILIQGVLLGILLKRIGERGVVLSGIIVQALGSAGLALAAVLTGQWILLSVTALLFAGGQALMTAALDGLLSTSVSDKEQGWLAGSMASLQSIIGFIAPLLAGALYAGLGHPTPYILGVIMFVAAIVVLRKVIAKHEPKSEETALEAKGNALQEEVALDAA